MHGCFRTRHNPPLALISLLLLAVVTARSACSPATPPDAYAPPFARVPYAPTSRASVVAVELREGWLFGAPVDDDPPAFHRPPAAGEKPEREEGLWQHVREYWWLRMSADSAEAAWTGKHYEPGMVLLAGADGYCARRIA